MTHDWRNWKTCQCGLPGCGSYRSIPGGPTSREIRKTPFTPINDDDPKDMSEFTVGPLEVLCAKCWLIHRPEVECDG